MQIRWLPPGDMSSIMQIRNIPALKCLDHELGIDDPSELWIILFVRGTKYFSNSFKWRKKQIKKKKLNMLNEQPEDDWHAAKRTIGVSREVNGGFVWRVGVIIGDGSARMNALDALISMLSCRSWGVGRETWEHTILAKWSSFILALFFPPGSCLGGEENSGLCMTSWRCGWGRVISQRSLESSRALWTFLVCTLWLISGALLMAALRFVFNVCFPRVFFVCL